MPYTFSTRDGVIRRAEVLSFKRHNPPIRQLWPPPRTIAIPPSDESYVLHCDNHLFLATKLKKGGYLVCCLAGRGPKHMYYDTTMEGALKKWFEETVA